MTSRFVLEPRGPFNRAASREYFGGWASMAGEPGTIVMAFPVEAWRGSTPDRERLRARPREQAIAELRGLRGTSTVPNADCAVRRGGAKLSTLRCVVLIASAAAWWCAQGSRKARRGDIGASLARDIARSVARSFSEKRRPSLDLYALARE
jgi:hypothetical protein